MEEPIVRERPALLRLLLVGVDGSVGSRRAAGWAARAARDAHAEVLAVHVLTYNRELLRDVTPDTMRTWRLDLQRQLETEWVEPFATAGVEHSCRLVESDSPATGLLETAAREHADLLIVGANGHGGFADRVLGGVSYRVAHRASQPVVVVPPDWAQGP